MRLADPDKISLRRSRSVWLWKDRHSQRTIKEAFADLRNRSTFNNAVGQSGFFFHGLHYPTDTLPSARDMSISDEMFRNDFRRGTLDVRQTFLNSTTIMKTQCPFCGKKDVPIHIPPLMGERAMKHIGLCSCRNAFGDESVVAASFQSNAYTQTGIPTTIVSLSDAISNDGKTVVVKGVSEKLTLPSRIIKNLNTMVGFDTINPIRYMKGVLHNFYHLIPMEAENVRAFITGESCEDDEETMMRVAVLKVNNPCSMNLRMTIKAMPLLPYATFALSVAALIESAVLIWPKRESVVNFVCIGIPCTIEETGSDGFVVFQIVDARAFKGFKYAKFESESK